MTQGSHSFVTSDRYVEMETVLFSLPAIVALPAILAFETENFYFCDCSDPCVKAKSTEHEFQRSRPLFQKIFISLLSFTAIVRIGFWRQTSKICAIVV